jgi:cytoskeletal protein CcmA (bactofilin family)
MRNGKRAGALEDFCFFEKGVKLEGTLDIPGTFRLEGEVKGTVRCGDQVIVGEHARVEGDVQGAIVSVAGQIKGNVTGKNRVEILSSGAVEGEVSTTCLVIEPGGVLDGQCHMRNQTESANAPQPANFATHASGVNH